MVCTLRCLPHQNSKCPPFQESLTPVQHLATNLPIAGYKGHIPGLALNSERSFSISSRACIKAFEGVKAQNTAAL
jgi:hypothetical protein